MQDSSRRVLFELLRVNLEHLGLKAPLSKDHIHISQGKHRIGSRFPDEGRFGGWGKKEGQGRVTAGFLPGLDKAAPFAGSDTAVSGGALHSNLGLA